MAAIYILIPIAIAFTAVGLYVFFWAVKSDQFEDLDKQGLSILFDDKDIETTKSSATNLQNVEQETKKKATRQTIHTQQKP